MAAPIGSELGLVKPLSALLAINLLPHSKRRKMEVPRFQLPIPALQAGMAAVLLAAWVVFGAQWMFASMHLAKVERASQSLRVPRLEADQLAAQRQQFDVKSAHLEHMRYPGFDWTAFLDVMISNLPDNIWLSELSVTLEEPYWTLEVHGFAKPTSEGEMLDTISAFSAALKTWLDERLAVSKPKVAKAAAPAFTPPGMPTLPGMPPGAPPSQASAGGGIPMPAELMKFLTGGQAGSGTQKAKEPEDNGSLKTETITDRKQAGRLVITEFTMTFTTQPDRSQDSAQGMAPSVPQGMLPEGFPMPPGGPQQR